MGKAEYEMLRKDLERNSKMNRALTETQIQAMVHILKNDTKETAAKRYKEIEELRHKNIMEEIKALEKAKITKFERT